MVSCVVLDGGVAGVQNDDPRLSSPSGYSTRRFASVTGKLHFKSPLSESVKNLFHVTTGQKPITKT